MTENRYVFDNAVTAETGMRFSGLEATFDPATIRYLTGVGVTNGWACWELGADGGSIATWLAERVGPAGSVLATDIDVRFIPGRSPGPGRGHRVPRRPHVNHQHAHDGVGVGTAAIRRTMPG
jgi:hypothetical protein